VLKHATNLIQSRCKTFRCVIIENPCEIIENMNREEETYQEKMMKLTPRQKAIAMLMVKRRQKEQGREESELNKKEIK
jgi:hypothetical protein